MTQNSIVTVMEGILLEAVGCSGILQLVRGVYEVSALHSPCT